MALGMCELCLNSCVPVYPRRLMGSCQAVAVLLGFRGALPAAATALPAGAGCNGHQPASCSICRSPKCRCMCSRALQAAKILEGEGITTHLVLVYR